MQTSSRRCAASATVSVRAAGVPDRICRGRLATCRPVVASTVGGLITTAGRRRVTLVDRNAGLVEVGRAEDPSDAYDPRTRPWYKLALGEHAARWTKPYVFFSTGRPGITNAQSVGGVDGIAVGVVGVDIELSRLMRRLHRRATIDELTGILNRAHLFERGTRAIADARRQRHPLAVAVFDLDGFKDLNDRNGHRAGDDALREVSARFAALCRADDHVGRLGGDEFALVLPRTGPLEAQQLAERLCAAIGATPLATSAGPVTLTASVGVASLGPTDASFDDVLAAADLRMLSAKSTDRRRGSLVRATDDAVMR